MTEDKCKRSKLSILKQGAITELPFLKFKLPATQSPACMGLYSVLSMAYDGSLHKADFYRGEFSAVNQTCLYAATDLKHIHSQTVGQMWSCAEFYQNSYWNEVRKYKTFMCVCMSVCYLRKIGSPLKKHLHFTRVLLFTHFSDMTNWSISSPSALLKVADWFSGSVSNLDFSMALTFW